MNISKKILILLVGVLVTASLSTIATAQTPYDMPEWGFLAAGACLIWVILWFVIWILVAIWVYRDAEKRGKSGVLWLIVVILLGLVGLIIWLVVRGEKTASSRNCPNCGRAIPEDARVCPYCSKNFEQ